MSRNASTEKRLPIMLDPKQLQALSAVAQEGSVARAAQYLGWSHPTIDYHLRALESLVAAPLVARSSRGTTLTPAGFLMNTRGREVMALSERALGDVREIAQQGKTRLRFGTFPTAAARLLPGIASRLRACGVELTAVLEEITPLVTEMNQRTLDAVIVYRAKGHSLQLRSDVYTVPLFTDPLLLALPQEHPAASKDSLSVADITALDDIPWVLSATPGDSLDAVVHELFSAAETDVNVSVRTDDFAVGLSLVAAGLGMAIVPRLAAVQAPPGVVLRHIDDPRFERQILLAMHNPCEVPQTVLRHLSEAVRRSIADLNLGEI